MGWKTAANWAFSSALPSGWSPASTPHLAPAAHGLLVRTTSTPSAYQIWSGSVRLAPGKYVALVRGSVSRGGIEIGALDADANSWLSTSHYWSGQRGFDAGVMATSFELTTPRRVRVVLSNWSASPYVSRWTVQQVVIAHAP